MYALLLTAAATAGTIGNPGRTTETGVIGAQAAFAISAQTLDLENDPSCEENCAAIARVSGSGARISLRPIDALGLWGEATWATDVLEGADHSAKGPMFAGGGSLTLQRHGVKPALAARGQYLSTSSTVNDEGYSSDNKSLSIEGAAFAVFGDDSGGGNLWLGPIATVFSTHDIAIYGDEGERLSYAPRIPVGAVIGGEMLSVPLGRYLRPHSPRMSAGLEARLIDSWGASGWIGVAY